ncbi:prephenate dehydrogenase [Clavulina sp. PMI_390]|nr:prephenate dehydrogenase [Clavulina sp. PMI_390]
MASPARLSPSDPVDQQPCIGLIGMGDMGSMYARHLSSAGWGKLVVCDRPEKFEMLAASWKDVQGVTVLRDGHAVSRMADYIIYSVEAEYIDSVVEQYGPSTRIGAVVGGQTSVKAPERAAFEKHLPEDVDIVSCHSLHGPTVNPEGEPLVIIRHRASDRSLALVEDVLRSLKSRYVYLTYEEHDTVTANTQAVTHAAFLSMGTAWHMSQQYPWEDSAYVGGIETVKVNITLRIYANKWHVYAGLALLNPHARIQIDQYAKSCTEIFKLMLGGQKDALSRRMYAARAKVFPAFSSASSTPDMPIFLSESVLDQFSLNTSTASASPNSRTPNSHLSILAMVDSWAALNILPFAHLTLAATPVFRMWIGVAEALFRSTERLDRAVDAAIDDTAHRSDDLEFTIAARGWSQCVSFGSFELYADRFGKTRAFFEPRFEEANQVGGKMIKTILQDAARRERETA